MSNIIYAALFVIGIVVISSLVINIETSDQNRIKRFASYEELNSFLKANVESSSLYGSFGVTTAVQPMLAESTAVKTGAASYSTTNIQVAGVDEADFVKNDGKYIYVVSENRVVIVDAYPAEDAKILSEIEVNGTPREIFINKDRLVVFGQEFYNGKKLQGKISESIAIPSYYSQKSFINVYDISDRENPVLVRNVLVDGNYHDSRMIGDYVYSIINQPVYYYEKTPIPMPLIESNGKARAIPASEIYYFDFPDRSYIFTNIVSLNTQDDNEEMNEKVFLLGYTQNLFVSTDNIYITYMKRISEYQMFDKVIAGILSVLPSEVANEMEKIRSSDISNYEKTQNISRVFNSYIESLNPEKAAELWKKMEERMWEVQQEIAKETEKTVIHKISIDDGKIEYVTKGEVPGNVLNQFSMDENNGYFRIATTTSGFGGGTMRATVMPLSAERIDAARTEMIQQTGVTAVSQSQVAVTEPSQGSSENLTPEAMPVIEQPVVQPIIERRGPTSQNHVYILDSNLKIVGKVEDLAPGERIYSVRFLGDKGYMVTFRQIDPLFVIDLKDPYSPKVLGYLKIPGVSDYLHPYDENHVIGVGRDATEEGRIQGMKLSLFDVSDVENPKEVSKYTIGERGTYSEVLNDHKAFLFDKSKNLLAMPVSVVEGGKWDAFQGAYVFNLDLENGFALKGKVSHGTTSEGYYDYSSQIRRSLYMGDVLYTVSNKMVKANSLDDLREISKVELLSEKGAVPIPY